MSGADRPTRIRNRYGRFAQIPEVLVRDPGVSDRAIRLYALLWTYSAEKGRKVWPSRSTMAATLHVSKKTIDRGIRELEERGAISVEADYNGDRQTANVYTILVLSDTPKVIHRGDRFDAPQLSTGGTDLTPSGGPNLSPQEEEPEEEELHSSPRVSHQTPNLTDSGTGRSNPAATPKTLSATHGKPLQPADVFAAVGRSLPDTFDDAQLEQLAGEILDRAATRVLDPTGYVIRTLRDRDLASRGYWLTRADDITRDHTFDHTHTGARF